MKLNVEVSCQCCGGDLDVVSVGMYGDNRLVVTAEPCSRCLKDLENEIREELKDAQTSEA